MSTGNFVRIVALVITLAMSATITPAISAEKQPPAQVLFTNVNIVDGKADKLADGVHLAYGYALTRVSDILLSKSEEIS